MKKRDIEVRRSSSSRGHWKPAPIRWPHWPGPWQMPPGAGSLPADLQACGRNITPACQKALYEIPNAYIKDDVNMLGLYESGDKYSQQDLNSFFTKYAPWVPQNTHPLLDSIDGGLAPVAPSSADNTGESDIDMSISFSMIHVSPSRIFAEEIALIQDSLKQ